mmetsp:Transcript_6412/g.15858  ORF Transcript_6412/g.15858 Transcript_6412/m.15858 type:complete len:86 (-) Transcript_6412:727-984(-)
MGALCCCPQSPNGGDIERGGGRFGNPGAAGDDDAWMGAKTGGEQWETVQQYGQKETYSGGEDEVETVQWTTGEVYGTESHLPGGN